MTTLLFRHNRNGVLSVQQDQLFSRPVGDDNASRLIIENDGASAACDNAFGLVVLVPSLS